MSKIARKTQKIFGSAAGFHEIAEYGSLAAGTPAFTTDPAVIQSLSNYLGGWFSAVIGQNSPAIEDMNALCYLFAYQLAYIFQAGIAEWDSGTTYYIGSMVNSGGQIYVSLTDNNLNNAVSSTTNWELLNANRQVTSITSSSSPYTVLPGDQEIAVDCTSGNVIVNLPALSSSLGRLISFDKIDASANTLTIVPAGADTFEGGSTSYVLNDAYQSQDVVGLPTIWKIRG